MLNEYIKYLELKNINPKTVQNVKRHIMYYNEFIQRKNLDKIGICEPIAIRYIYTLNLKTPQFRLNALNSLISYLSFLKIDVKGLRDLKPQIIPDTKKQPTYNQLVEFVEKIDQNKHFYYKFFFELILCTGCRFSEIQKLTYMNFDYSRNNNVNSYTITIQTKTKKIVTKLISNRCEVMINILLNKKQPPETQIFRYISLEAINKILYNYFNPLNLECTSHSFRFAFAQKILQETNDVYTAKQMLGHSQIQSTEKYITPITQTIVKTFNTYFNG